MTNLIAAMGTALPLLLGSGLGTTPARAELGGTVLEQSSRLPFPSPLPVEVRLFAGARLVARASADLDGTYALRAEPGTYWAQIVVGADERWAEQVTVAPGSTVRHFRIPSEPGDVMPAVVQSLPHLRLFASERTAGFGSSHSDDERLVSELRVEQPAWWETSLLEAIPGSQAQTGSSRGDTTVR